MRLALVCVPPVPVEESILCTRRIQVYAAVRIILFQTEELNILGQNAFNLLHSRVFSATSANHEYRVLNLEIRQHIGIDPVESIQIPISLHRHPQESTTSSDKRKHGLLQSHRPIDHQL